jgi:hypothetical protein
VLLILLIVLLILFGGGGGYWGYRSYGPLPAGFIVLVVLIAFLLTYRYW